MRTTYEIGEILSSAAFSSAANDLRENHDRFVEDIVRIAEIPAPPFEEDERAAAYEGMFREHGLEEVGRDAIGNVTGIRRGRANGRAVVLAAHLDTVFPKGTDCTVRREGTKLFAPGIGDDSRGLAALLAFVRALDAGGVETEADLLFVGDVGEEGKGDLRGVRHLFTEGQYRDRIDAFFTIDGLQVEEVTTIAVGSHRYRVAFRGPGGHSFSAFGIVNPAHALGDVLAGMAKLEVPDKPRTTYCASVFGGGTSINAIPEEVWVEIDLRSESQEELDRLDGALHALVEAAVTTENARRKTEVGAITADLQRIGQRPAGKTDHQSPIVQATFAALAAFGFEARERAGSTDANIPISLGIPAICLGSGGTGGRAHSLEEWIDVEPELSARGLSAGLAAILGTAGLRSDQS
ncbi:M20/M25/M40 family metallo-hydrolase [uncultured Jannaschia sp.]|uniref:M20/M25/M40 family metallo-hydrolase n=1 Tax=uncultured Jannaschia sp. TaxID=293347 RepID=UPI00261F14FF|nr:M20/M25/M40 family metallo-hydrolase [uncultured Jannaschia sp.]